MRIRYFRRLYLMATNVLVRYNRPSAGLDDFLEFNTVVHLAVEQIVLFFFFQAEDGIRDHCVTGVQTCALPIYLRIMEIGQLAFFKRNLPSQTTLIYTGHNMARVAGLESQVFSFGLVPSLIRSQIGRASCRERV